MNITPPNFQPNHLSKLKDCLRKEKIEEWGPRMSAKAFVDAVFREGHLPELKSNVSAVNDADEKASRCDVRKFVARKDATNLDKTLFVMAWGSMNIRNAKYALESYGTYWETIVNNMLDGNICRDEAYKQFHCLVKNGKLKGMGPAYFTKLIYFLEPTHNGYIMDQWTARSMNLLRSSDHCKIHLIATNWTSNRKFRNFRVHSIKNDVAIYSAFCEDLEDLARFLDMTPDETEKQIFSRGGRWENKGCWRRYVLEETSCL